MTIAAFDKASVTRESGRPVIEVQQVYKQFPRKSAAGEMEDLRVLDGVSLEVQDCEFVSIIGPSGCGKTTLLRMLAGMARPEQGRVLVAGEEVRGPGPERAMVFQDYALLPWADALTNVAFGLKLRGMGKEQRLARAQELLELVGLEGFEHSLPKQLSGGMQQRIGLARALAVEPQILLMDEPFGSLDEISRRGMQVELLRIWEQHKKTAVFVTHSVDEAVFLSDRVVVMTARPGRIAAVLSVDLPRPRSRDMEESAPFGDIRAAVWRALGT
ncbi:MAG TPA: ABC transporter ATP-binding protein [Chloroflexota bacterium]|jgi:NitT/TauT family transport system ATP-binding protein